MVIIDGKYKMENTILGSGGFSKVFLGTEILTNQPVAIKRVKLFQKNLKNNDGLKNLKSEIELMQTFNHPNIVKYYDVVMTPDVWYIIMEYCNMGTLQDVINFNESMSKKKSLNFNREANTYYYLNQLKDALDYLRKSECIHRDIKPMNVLLTKRYDLSLTDSGTIFKSDEQLAREHGSPLRLSNSFDKSNPDNFDNKDKIIVKLADFGLARKQLFQLADDFEKPKSKMPQIDNEELLMKTICGSPLYMAPEVILVKEYDSKAELWSFGIIMYELLFGTHPQKATSMPQLINNLKSQDINFQLHKNFTPECFDLLKKLLNKNPDKRIKWSDFFNHKWFDYWKNINYDDNDKIFVKNTSSNVNKLNLINGLDLNKQPEKTRTDYFAVNIGKNSRSPTECYTGIYPKQNIINKSSDIKRKPTITLNPIITETRGQIKNISNLRNSSKKNSKTPSEPIKISINQTKPHQENNSPRFYSQIGSPNSPESPLGKSNLSRMRLDNFHQSYTQGTYAEHSASYPPVESEKISRSLNPSINKTSIPISINKTSIPIPINNNNYSYERSNSYGCSSSLGKSSSRNRIFQNFDIQRKNSINNNNSISLQDSNTKSVDLLDSNTNLTESNSITTDNGLDVSENNRLDMSENNILDVSRNGRLDMSQFVITKFSDEKMFDDTNM